MDQRKNEREEGKRPFPWRMIVYMVGIVLVGHSMGLLLYPYLKYPSIVAYALLGIGLVLLAITAPLLHK